MAEIPKGRLMSEFFDRFRAIPPEEVNPRALEGLTVAVLGYGNQGRAQALNLRDSGVRVIVGNRAGSERHLRAREDGFTVLPMAECPANADVLHLLMPDDQHGAVFTAELLPHLTGRHTIAVSHGFSILYKTVVPPPMVDVVLVSPKGVGAMVRQLFTEGRGTPVLVAVQQNASGNALPRAIAHAAALGGSRAGIYETTLKDETECDLFGEQAVLCGGVPELLCAAFDTLVAEGYPPEMAYFECIHELKLIADLVYARGLAGMRRAISPAAEVGAYRAGPRVVTGDTRAAMLKLLKEIQNGTFARDYLAEMAAGGANRVRERTAREAHGSEEAGAEIRRRMPWL